MDCLLHKFIYWALITSVYATGLKLPDNNCESDQYYDPASLTCQSCPANSSTVTSNDGFGCSCEDHSIPIGVSRCKPCNATEIISADGAACVPRRCQNVSGKLVCRKCPADYISVTQNFDGSRLKEVLCVKCTRGYKPQGNVCVKCEACTCAKNQIVVRGICIPKSYVNERPKYEESVLHPTALLDIVKHEYLCTQNDQRACRALANECVKNLYSSDQAGPCRLWIQSKSAITKGLPQLTTEPTANNQNPGEISLTNGKDTLLVAVAVYTSAGGLMLIGDTNNKILPCHLPVEVEIRKDLSIDCELNISKLSTSEFNETLAPYLYIDGVLHPLPVSLQKPNGYHIQAGSWPTNKFKRYFLVHNALSITANITNTIYLRTLLVRLRIERDKRNSGLKVHITTEAQYATKSALSAFVSMTLKVEYEMPCAGVLRGLEIWGGILGALLSLYAVVQWRGVLRRGGLYVSAAPLLAGAVADILYFSTLLSTLHPLAVEASMLGLTLPLSRGEENLIKAFIYSSVSLKAIKIVWLNWHQCRCDVLFLDWSEYYSPWKEASIIDKSNSWRTTLLAREWTLLQTKRRVSPGVVVTLTLLVLHVLTPWQSYLPQNQGYKWAVASVVWWTSYTVVLLSRWLTDRLIGSPSAIIPKICTGVGLSLLVFEEEYYAHYVHGRSDDSKDVRSMPGPRATCRVVCAPQVRTAYKQLSTPGLGSLGDNATKQALLSRFVAAFFERALDGLSWVASERTIFERLLNVEINSREAGNTSTLLYDDDTTPSCFAVTWWGEEWNLATFDVMMFSCVLVASDDDLLAALVTVTLWQILKFTRTWFGKRNLKAKTDIEIY